MKKGISFLSAVALLLAVLPFQMTFRAASVGALQYKIVNGAATITAARTRPKLIGGERARYTVEA